MNEGKISTTQYIYMEQTNTNPTLVAMILVVWSILLFIMIYFALTNEKSDTTFLRFGPAKKTDKKVSKFLGIQIDSWTKVVAIMMYVFVSQIIKTYTYTIIKPWLTNNIYDDKTKSLDVSFAQVFFITNAYTVFNWFNRIIGTFLYFTLELQFIIPDVIANLIFKNITTYYYVKNKSLR